MPPEPLPNHFYHFDRLYELARLVIVTAGLVLIFYFGFKALSAFAGEETRFSVFLSLLASEAPFCTISVVLGCGGGWYGWRQRQLRGKTIDRLQGRIRDLETNIDPNRTSSGLTTFGQTHPTDRLGGGV